MDSGSAATRIALRKRKIGKLNRQYRKMQHRKSYAFDYKVRQNSFPTAGPIVVDNIVYQDKYGHTIAIVVLVSLVILAVYVLRLLGHSNEKADIF